MMKNIIISNKLSKTFTYKVLKSRNCLYICKQDDVVHNVLVTKYMCYIDHLRYNHPNGHYKELKN
jgi:hypothetical protein